MVTSRSEEDSAFSGFPQAGLDFLRALKENNDREWFRARKELYEGQVKRPMELLATESAARCRKSGLLLRTKEKNPVLRIYRDIRFSADKRPFNTHVGAALKSSQPSAGYGEVYIHISPAESFVAAGFWMPERPLLQIWRESIADKPAAFLRLAKALGRKGLTLSNESSLKRLPRGFDRFAEDEVAPFLKLTSYVVSRKVTAVECQSPAMVDLVHDFALAAKPLLEYGWALNYAKQRDILEER